MHAYAINAGPLYALQQHYSHCTVMLNVGPCGSCCYCRVLQPGGSFLLVTLGDPTRRLPLLLDPRLQWKVSLLLLPKISAACQAYVDGK
jgi:hypothetical protein